VTIDVTTPVIQCEVVGVGAWGPGFADWPGLQARLLNPDDAMPLTAVANPSPQVIPANERRRAPLPVRIAVEVSWQALQQSGLKAEDVACVFGSGLGDTEITDYMCRVLTTELKQLSPTKFHNSVHNAAAGYWTISSGCMKSANSIAAYQMTAGLALLEGMTQCVLQQEPVLVTLFDTEAHAVYRQIFPCSQSFGASVLLRPVPKKPASGSTLLTLTPQKSATPSSFAHPQLESLYAGNPAAKILGLLDALARLNNAATRSVSTLAISPTRAIDLTLSHAE
jgi:hypothetical protein